MKKVKEKIIKNNLLQGYIAIILLILGTQLIKGIINLNPNNLGLTWTGSSIIPLILNLRGELPFDFVSNSLLNTPIIYNAKFLSFLLPKNHDLFISNFALLNYIFHGFIRIFASINIALFINLILEKENQLFSKKKLFFIFLLLSPFYFDFFLIKKILIGYELANWNYPIDDSLSSTGISSFLSIISIIIPLLIENNLLILKEKFKIIYLFTAFTFHLFSIIINPAVALFQVSITLIIAIILNGTKKKNIKWNWLCLIYFIAWLSVSILLKSVHNQGDINNLEFFRIYVLERHSHHYLTSTYIKNAFSSKIFFINIIIFVYISITNLKFSKKDLLQKTIYVSTFFITFVHLIQLIFVEIIKNKFFIILGISRMSSCFNFLYISICIAFLMKKFYKPETQNLISIFLLNKSKKIIFFLITLFIYLILNFHNIYFENSKSSPAKILSQNLVNSNLDINSEFIIDDNVNDQFERLREIAKLNIYYDYYFPFNNQYIKEWEIRKNKVDIFKTCLVNIDSKCLFFNDHKNKLFFLSDKYYEKLKIFKKLEIKNKLIYIYGIN